MDPLTPLLHDFFYQPMIYDLLNIESDVADFEGEIQGKKVEKKAILNDQDELFRTYK